MNDWEPPKPRFNPLHIGRSPTIRDRWTAKHGPIRIYDGAGNLKRIVQPKVDKMDIFMTPKEYRALLSL